MLSDLELSRRVEGKVAVLVLAGQIDYDNCHELRDAIDDCLDDGLGRILIDAKGLSFIDSSCIGMLVAALRKVGEQGGRMCMVVSTHIERVLTVSGMTTLFELFADTESALRELK